MVAEPLGEAQVATQRSGIRKRATTEATAAMRLTKDKQAQRTQDSAATVAEAAAVRKYAGLTCVSNNTTEVL